jgi:hypothetical protein
MHGQRDLVHVGTLDASALERVLLAPALLEAGEGAMLAGGVDERRAARVDIGLTATQVDGRGLLRALRALDVGLHRQQPRAAGIGDAAARMARLGHALGRGLQLLLAVAMVGEAGGQLLGRALLGTLAKHAYALEAKLKGTSAHEPVIGGQCRI